MSEPPGQLLTWDSTFFGHTVARLNQGRLDASSWERARAWCEREHVDWLYFLADTDDAATVRTAEGAGFALVDIRMRLARSLDSTTATRPVVRSGCRLRDATASDIPALEAIAADVHADSRFFFDPKLPRAKAQALYRTWIRHSVEGQLADRVIVVELQGVVSGYITGKRDSADEGSIGLLGLGASARGLGLGAALVHASVNQFVEEKLERVAVVTQGRNTAAQRVYQRCGFVTDSVHLWYHKWFL